MSDPSQDKAEIDAMVAGRKDAHLDLCLEEDVGSGGLAAGLGGYLLEYDALPEVDLDQVDLSVTVCGKTLRAPIVIGAMTGGTKRAGEINARLARAAARCGVGMALGSQRAMIVDPSLRDTFAARDAAPDLPLLFGNVGLVQLNYGVTHAQVQDIISSVDVDVLNLHLNALQEAIQPEGDIRFAGLMEQVPALVEALDVPVFAKEVGAGVGPRAAAKLAELPLAGIEVSGVGGTSWAKVESFRAPDESPQRVVGRRLAGFGVPTGPSVRYCRKAFGPDRVVVASGGIRTGMDIAVAIALGADVGALARPLLEAADESEDRAVAVLETLIYELKVICFCTGSVNLAALRRVMVRPPGRGWVGHAEDEFGEGR